MSKASIDALRNPFGVDGQTDLGLDEENEEAGELDLASWGLDTFMPKEKKSAKAKGKQPAVSSTRSGLVPSTSYESPAENPRRAIVTSKAMSLGGHVELETAILGERRRSFGSPLDLVGMEAPDIPLPRRRATSQASMLSQPAMVPFPTSSLRSPSPGPDQLYTDSRPAMHDRTYSMASMNSKILLEDGDGRGRSRNPSIGTIDRLTVAEDNPFAIEHSTHLSRFDPKSAARARTNSIASMGSRMMLDDAYDGMSVMTGDPRPRDRPYSTMELMRPKVLVMPSPLQPISTNLAPQPIIARDGFEISTDGPPLPPGAKSSRRMSVSVFDAGVENVPLASNSFTPNPMVDLTLSQKTFRNTLAVGAQNSPYMNLDLPRATEDGEQAALDPSQQEEPATVPVIEELPSKALRPAGKLYGKSLIDDLESRKANMRSKQRYYLTATFSKIFTYPTCRVFKGDQRPSMMAREQQRSSTLIDPASLAVRPATQRMSSYGSQNTTQTGLARRTSTIKPLLNFDGDDAKLSPNATRMPATRSVFGVDTLWEREMVKLKEIQAREEVEEEERRKREAEEERKRLEKEKRKRKKKGKGSPEVDEVAQQLESSRISMEPPTLPNIERATRRAPPKPSESDLSSDSEEESPLPVPVTNKVPVPSWHAGSSDEEDGGPRRTTGVGLRYPNQTRKMSAPPPDDDSEEDVPLAATIHKAVARATFSGANAYPQDSDDEDEPLSKVIAKAHTSPARNRPPKARGNQSDEDDDQPLGLRASRIPTGNPNAGDEDDMPLAFHPEQQRRTQYQMLAQQQQQQQMMMQAQMQSAMMMNASMMGSFYGPMMNPMATMPMQLPMPIPSPPPMADEASFGRVDRWRRDVAVDGEK